MKYESGWDGFGYYEVWVPGVEYLWGSGTDIAVSKTHLVEMHRTGVEVWARSFIGVPSPGTFVVVVRVL